MKGGTGIMIDNKNMKNNFINFLNNSSIEFVGKGTYGIVVRATLPQNLINESKYLQMDPTNFGKPATSIIIKIGAIEYINPEEDDDNLISSSDEDAFINEVNIQTEVFLKTMNTLQPLCPAIVYSSILTNKDILQTIHDKLTNANKKQLIENMMNKINKYSIIAMELLENYKTFHRTMIEINDNTNNLEEDEDNNEQENEQEKQKKAHIKEIRYAFIYCLIELFKKTGYVHQDFHASNLMINMNDPSYFEGKNYAPILIDFGNSVKIPPDTYSIMNELLDNHNYAEFFRKMCEIPSATGLNLRKYDLYETICQTTGDKTIIDDLIKRKNEATDKIILLFNSKTNERNIYPLLPLSNSVKNKMFPGMQHNTTPIKNLVNVPKIPDDTKRWEPTTYRRSFMYITRVFYNFKNNKTINLDILTCFYNTAYIFNTIIPYNTSDIQLCIICGLYYSGFKYSEDTLMNTFGDDGMTPKKISTIIIKFKDFFANNKLITIMDYLSTAQVKRISNLSKDEFVNIYVDKASSYLILMLTDPKEWINEWVKRSNSNAEKDEYSFPFKNKKDVFGGNKLRNINKKCIKRKTKRKTRKTRKTRKNLRR